MIDCTTVKKRAKLALWKSFNGTFDSKGYTSLPTDNLLPGVDLESVREDLEQGDGSELNGKFRAVHSSSALAVNSFGWFKCRTAQLSLLGHSGAKSLSLEKRLKIFSRGTPPNLDAWVEQESQFIAVESKLLEHICPTKPGFSQTYEKLAPPVTDQVWWAAYKAAKAAGPSHLDVAQLIKHGFGIGAYCKQNPKAKVTLLYVYWEPLNWKDFDVFVKHRDELKVFGKSVKGAAFKFKAISYPELWQEWSTVPALKTHARNLEKRYLVSI